MDDVSKWKAKVTKAALVEEFQLSDIGRTIIQWLNAEVYRLTSQLANDDELDTDNVRRAAVRGELKAYRLIGEKMNMTKLQGNQASATLMANDINVEAFDPRTPADIASDAGL